MPAARDRAQMKALGEVGWISSDTKLPLRPSRLSLGFSGSHIKDISVEESLPGIFNMVEEIHAQCAGWKDHRGHEHEDIEE